MVKKDISLKEFFDSEEFDDFQELKINSGEYLKELIVRFPDNVQYLTQLGFVTNKKNKIVVGNDDSGKLRIIEMKREEFLDDIDSNPELLYNLPIDKLLNL